MNLDKELAGIIEGEVKLDSKTIAEYSRDWSLFEVKPRIVVFPKNSDDIKKIVHFVTDNKIKYPNLSITARSAGTDMSGGPLNEGIILVFTKYINSIKKIDENNLEAIVEPGVYYRDFEKQAKAKSLLFPSYPASKHLCAWGGIINNNSGGEKSLAYGKTDKYVKQLKVILSDGNEYEIKPIARNELNKKIQQKNFEGRIYSHIYQLLQENKQLIESARPRVSKNSSGYNLWDIWDGKTFDLTKLFVGAQGTLGILTEATVGLVREKPYSGLVVIFTKDLRVVVDLIHKILPFKPTSLESFDDHTFKVAIKFLSDFVKILGAKNIFSLFWSFMPEFWMIFSYGIPKLIILAEFEGDTQSEVDAKIKSLLETVKNMPVKSRIARTKAEAEKYWAMRRKSFELLHNRILSKQTAPFIDDIVVSPDNLPEFWPKFHKILDKYELLYTIAGHIGDGNFHVIPLMDLKDKKEREKIFKAAEEVYTLISEFNGSISGEHNDGLIRTPFLSKMYSSRVLDLFDEVKHIFDPKEIFNPRKKVGGSLSYAVSHLRTS